MTLRISQSGLNLKDGSLEQPHSFDTGIGSVGDKKAIYGKNNIDTESDKGEKETESVVTEYVNYGETVFEVNYLSANADSDGFIFHRKQVYNKIQSLKLEAEVEKKIDEEKVDKHLPGLQEKGRSQRRSLFLLGFLAWIIRKLRLSPMAMKLRK